MNNVVIKLKIKQQMYKIIIIVIHETTKCITSSYTFKSVLVSAYSKAAYQQEVIRIHE